MTIIKIIRNHTTGYGRLESPTYYEVSVQTAEEMMKYKNYYHFMHYLDVSPNKDRVRIQKEVKEPDYTIDFKEQCSDIDFSKIGTKELLAEYINEITDKYDKYGNLRTLQE